MQSCIADSTMEAEYVAASEAAKKEVWLRNFLLDLGVVPSMQLPITLYCDNSGAVANSKEPRAHKKGKHIEHKYHLIKDIGLGKEEMCGIMALSLSGRLLGPYTLKAIFMDVYFILKIMLFHFNENLHKLSLHLNIMHVSLLFYIVDDLV